MFPFHEIGRTFVANTTVGARPITTRAESYEAGPDCGQRRKNPTVSPPRGIKASIRRPTVRLGSSPNAMIGGRGRLAPRRRIVPAGGADGGPGRSAAAFAAAGDAAAPTA